MDYLMVMFIAILGSPSTGVLADQRFILAPFQLTQQSLSPNVSLFELKASLNDLNVNEETRFYMAVAFSADQFMGNDTVVLCSLNGQNRSVNHFYTVKFNLMPLIDKKFDGLSNCLILVQNGFVSCSFERQNTMENVGNYSDISNTPYYLQFAKGPIDDDGVKKHDIQVVSDSMVFLTSSNQSSSSDWMTTWQRKRIHGCLMLISWLFLSSTSILIARYFKFIGNPDAQKSGHHRWFILHTVLISLAILTSLSGFIVILAAMQWTWSDGRGFGFIHSILGMVTLSLLAIQPIGAMFRPSKDHPKRFIFNLIHSSIGYICFLLSIVSIIVALFISSLQLDAKSWITMAAWIIWMFIQLIALETASMILKNKELPTQSNETRPQQSETLSDKKKEKKLHLIKYTFLAAHVALTGGATALVSYFIFNP